MAVVVNMNAVNGVRCCGNLRHPARRIQRGWQKAAGRTLKLPLIRRYSAGCSVALTRMLASMGQGTRAFRSWAR